MRRSSGLLPPLAAALSILAMGGAASPQNDPPKPEVVSKEAQAFLAQADWYGTVTVRLVGSGTGPGADGQEFVMERVSSATFHVAATYAYTGLQQSTQKILEKLSDPKTPPMVKKTMQDQMGLLKKEANCCRWFADPLKPDGQIQTSLHDSSTLRSRSTRVDGDVSVPGSKVDAFLEANTLDGVCKLSVSWSADVDVTTTYQGSSTPPRKSRERATPAHFVFDKLPLPKAGAPLEGGRSLTEDEVKGFKKFSFGDLDGTVQWSLRPKAPPSVALRADIPDYQNWLPEPSLDGDHVGKDRLRVEFRLETTGGGAPDDEMLFLQIHLTEVSREPGLAMNFPLHPSDSAEPMGDLVLPPKGDPGLSFVSVDRTAAVAKNCGTRFGTWIGARDGGAYGILQARAILKTGRIVDATIRARNGTDLDRIPIPRRTLPSKVGDAFKEKHGVEGKGDKEDDDPEPKGDSRYPGDGLSLYEEYRGFFMEGKFFRANPKKKDLFIFYSSKGRVKHFSSVAEYCLPAALERFAKATQLDVHYKILENEWDSKSRVINFNSSATTHEVDQHALFLRVSESLGGKYAGLAYAPSHKPTNPAGCEMVMAELAPEDPDDCRDAYDVDADDGVLTVVHELCHACNVYHHGEEKIKKMSWTASLKGETWTVLENGTPIRVLTEAGNDQTEKQAKDIGEGNHWVILVGDQNGLFSGDPKCYMCYPGPQAYRLSPASTDRYLITTPIPNQSYLCTSPDGKFTNYEKDPLNHSFFGHAADKRGNCAGQILVNDHYPPPTR